MPAPARKVRVRGLCVLSMFDREYNYVINEQGQPMYLLLLLLLLLTFGLITFGDYNTTPDPRYLGIRSSVLLYNKTLPSWVWYDRSAPGDSNSS